MKLNFDLKQVLFLLNLKKYLIKYYGMSDWKTRPKLVAPGGSYMKSVVAAAYGADEIYVGVPFTSLRMRQNKVWHFEELKKTIDAIHSYWKKALLTMNIFPRNQDIKVFEMVTQQIADVNADAIIFSDPWTYNIIRKYFPNTDLHLSTQTSSLNYESIKFRHELGVKRIVLARELHINEIKEIKEKVPSVELEVFVHWAVCMAYSGRCLLWDYTWWRPWNKWECNHACRYKYKVWVEEEKRPWKLYEMKMENEGTHIMSSKDLCTIDRLEEIIPYVDALKFEWRSKSEFYVWGNVKAYKHVMDSIIDWTEVDENIKNLVYNIPHREYWDWFLFHDLKKDFPDPEMPKSELKEYIKNNEAKSEIEHPENIAKVWDSKSISLKSPWPEFARNYFGVITKEFIEKNSKKYYKIRPKENIEAWLILDYLKPQTMWKLTILEIITEQWDTIKKATCNTGDIFVLTDIELKGLEILYKSVKA